MSKFMKLLIVLAVAVAIGVGMAKLNEVRQKFLAMTEEEQREYLRAKLAAKVDPEKMEEIENAVISALSGKSGI